MEGGGGRSGIWGSRGIVGRTVKDQVRERVRRGTEMG